LDGETSFQKMLTLKPHKINNWEEIVRENILIKSRFVDNDQKESGKRAALNLGHTVAHALEALFLQKEKPVLHGDAVAAGILIESYLAFKNKEILLPEHYFNKIKSYISELFPHISINESDFEELIKRMRHDKKSKKHSLTFSLLRKPGDVVLSFECSETEVLESLNYYITNV
jgi:3-dehydroquinate synthase